MIGVDFISLVHLSDFLRFHNAQSTTVLRLMSLPQKTSVNLSDENFSYSNGPTKYAVLHLTVLLKTSNEDSSLSQ
jgi:hypothetical protein